MARTESSTYNLQVESDDKSLTFKKHAKNILLGTATVASFVGLGDFIIQTDRIGDKAEEAFPNPYTDVQSQNAEQLIRSYEVFSRETVLNGDGTVDISSTQNFPAMDTAVEVYTTTREVERKQSDYIDENAGSYRIATDLKLSRGEGELLLLTSVLGIWGARAFIPDAKKIRKWIKDHK